MNVPEELLSNLLTDKANLPGLAVLAELYYQAGDPKAETYYRQCWNFMKSSNINISSSYIYKYLIPYRMLLYLFQDEEYSAVENLSRSLLKFCNDELIRNWYIISSKILESQKFKTEKRITLDRPIMVFVTDGGWESWDADTLKSRGLGGSETWMIRYSNEIAAAGEFVVFVFCNCGHKIKIIDEVIYMDISLYTEFVQRYEIDICIISRFIEYYPVTYCAGIKNIYIVFHDLMQADYILPARPELKKIFCISDWHVKYLKSLLPSNFRDKIFRIDYGIDSKEYDAGIKDEFSFIYPSFPNRGLYHLLKIFPQIREKYPRAHLNIFCRFDLDYVKKACGPHYQEILKMLEEERDYVTNLGWVNCETLKEYWKKSQVWLYPCTFIETCCLTKFEAFASSTLCITGDIGALPERNAGIIISAPAGTQEWRELTMEKISDFFNNRHLYDEIISLNKETADNYSWNAAAKEFLLHLKH
jgi:glycosyltransferase involved in cell wall biosynthesis